MHRKTFLLSLFILALVGEVGAISFRQIAYIPKGMTWGYGYIRGADMNHDGFLDLAFSATVQPLTGGILYYGYRPFNRYVSEDSFPRAVFWDVGYLDQDSLLDIATQAWDSSNITYVRVYESAARDSFPMRPVWSWRYEFNGYGTQPIYITDMDRDSQKEMFTADASVLYVFECRGDNNFQKVWWDTVTVNPVIGSSFAIGDFDQDGQMEFAIPTLQPAPSVLVYECTGDDRYQMIWTDTLLAYNMYDAVTGPDLDGDGKLEFIFGDLHGTVQNAIAGLWIYEAIGNNQYELSFTDSVPNLTDRGVYAVHSDCGDVDQDGRPELVWAIDRDWMVYKSNGNNQFQRVFSAYGDNGHNTTNIHIHDMNGNGYPEIIESGGNETHIWEVQPVKLDFPNGGELLYADSLCVIQWRNEDPFRADSFSLFFSADSGLSYTPIALGIPGSDSSYLWTVPRVTSSNCFVMLWAYQNATGWDFSDGPFRIRDGTGVSDHPPSTIHHPLLPLRVSPNPFITYAQAPGYEKSSFSLYDVSGRKVGVYKGDRIGAGLSAGIYFLKPEGENSKPLRIVKLR